MLLNFGGVEGAARRPRQPHMTKSPSSPRSISIPNIPFDFSSLPSANGAHTFQQTAGAAYYPQSDPNDIYSSGDDRDVPGNQQFQSVPDASRAGMPSYPQQGFANPYQQRMPMFPSPFDTSSSMGVFNPIPGGPSNFTQMQPSQKKRPKYTRSKAGCLTCRTKKIKVSIHHRSGFVSYDAQVPP